MTGAGRGRARGRDLVKITLRELALVAAGGLATAAAFPRLGLFVLAWVSLIPLLYSVARHTAGKAFLLGFVAGLFFNGLLLYWIPSVPRRFGGLSTLLSLGAYLALVVALSLFWAVFAFLFSRARQRYPRGAFILAPFIWVGVEYLLTVIFSGFPWGILGYSQYRNLPLVQSATLGGVFAVSFILILFQSLVALSLTMGNVIPSIIGLVLLAGAHVGGFMVLKPVEPKPGTFTAAIVQGNVPADLHWNSLSAGEQAKLFNLHLDLTRQAAARGATFVAWPESAVPLCFACDDPDFVKSRTTLERLAKSTKATLLFGTSEPAESGADPGRYSSSVCLSPDGTFSQYNKMHLVPFVEYTPYPSIFYFDERITEAVGEVTPGHRYVLHRFGDIPFAAPIGFEVIFPDLVRTFVKDGAEFLTTIANDGWYGRSAAPYQHFAIATFRAVENRRFLLRAAATGISAIVDPYGRILARSPFMAQAVLTGRITPRRRLTVYSQNGDVLPLTGLTLTFIFFILAVLTRPHERHKSKRDSPRPII